ncbi:hypothetical protein JRI60_26660 [Archangium violaceum]|uniref:hypothetical protein n=1 Tax=Archangium violaceum TaxID=83451 RepID=UPI00194E84A2|nr:hypothetical protein [Archangium violaceum]QRN92795.1 hypothetical protein JRI60_26660 [Archangium violaceum]
MEQPRPNDNAAPPAPSHAEGRWHRVAPPVFILIAFALSRTLYWQEGVHFDSSPILWFFQFIELDLLWNRLLESVYYLHAQPPLFNLFLGGVLQTFAEGSDAAFAAFYVGMGLLLALSLYGLMVRLRVPRWPSALLTVFFIASPATVVYENWLFYTYPETLLLCAAALFFHRFVSSGRVGAGMVLFGLLGALALMRSTFHVVWYLVVVGLVLLAGTPWRTVARAAALPLLLILALYTKNAVLFGTFSGSSWFGMNLAHIVFTQMPREELAELMREGKVSPLVKADPFQPLTFYPPSYRQVSGPDVPVLRREVKENRAPNFNHEAYIALSKDFARDSFAAIRARPGTYLRTVASGFRIFLTPAIDQPYVAGNRRSVVSESWLYNRYLLGMYGAQAPEMSGRWLTPEEISGRILWNWTALLVFGLGAAGVLAWKELRRSRRFSAEGATWMFLAFNILFVALTSNLFEYLENNRFRYPLDPLILALGVAAVAECVRALRARQHRRVAEPVRDDSAA